MTLLAIGLFAWLFSKPFFTVKQMRTAAQTRDMKALAKHIDLPALQENFREALRAENNPDSAATPEDAVTRAFLGVLAEDVVDLVVTPELIASILIARPVQPSGSWAFDHLEANPAAREIMQGYRDTTAERAEAESTEVAMGQMAIAMRYESLSRFVVRLTSPTWQNGTFALGLRRYGITTWKLADMRVEKPRSMSRGQP